MEADVHARCVILGAGGHASVVIDALLEAGEVQPYAVLDSDPARCGKDLLGVPIRGNDGLLAELVREGVAYYIVGVGGVGDNRPRQRLFELGLSFGLTPFRVRHPSAVCSRWARIGPGSQLLAGSIVNVGANLGVNVIVNSGAVVEHDCLVGDHVHLATGARMASTVRVGNGVHIGAGATIRQGLSIGEGAIVGAGAVVVKDVPPGAVVIGVPARPSARHQPDSPGRQ